MPSTYFSDREHGSLARVRHEVDASAWGGMVALIKGFIANGGFGIDFPDECSDGLGTIGTCWRNMGLAFSGEIPEIDWPIRADKVPPIMTVMDILEFCHEHVAEATQGSAHSFFEHYHLNFDRKKGRLQFRDRVNRILSRNKLAYELNEDGTVSRLAPPIFHETLTSQVFDSGDGKLDLLLGSARDKFLDPDYSVHDEALEKLWDAWERVKTLVQGLDKKASTKVVLDRAASEPEFRTLLENEALSLTEVGNKFHIRHSETTQIQIQTEDQVDYLFHRLFALIWLILRTK